MHQIHKSEGSQQNTITHVANESTVRVPESILYGAHACITVKTAYFLLFFIRFHYSAPR